MPEFSITWNRVCRWRRRGGDEVWAYEATLTERVLLNGGPTLMIAARLATINEERIDDLGECEQFWSAARRKLGRMSRLSARDVWHIEALLAERIARPVPQPLERATAVFSGRL
jgi:hypothetical protein